MPPAAPRTATLRAGVEPDAAAAAAEAEKLLAASFANCGSRDIFLGFLGFGFEEGAKSEATAEGKYDFFPGVAVLRHFTLLRSFALLFLLPSVCPPLSDRERRAQRAKLAHTIQGSFVTENRRARELIFHSTSAAVISPNSMPARRGGAPSAGAPSAAHPPPSTATEKHYQQQQHRSDAGMGMVALHRARFVDWSPSPVVAAAASADGSTLAAAREDGGLELWETEGWSCVLVSSRRWIVLAH